MTQRIQSIVDKFVSELTEAVQQDGADAIAQAFGLSSKRPQQRSANGHKPTRASSPPKGAKRDPGEIDTLTKSLLTAIKKSPGKRIEEIATSMNTTTKELQLPAMRLRKDKSVKIKGERRASKYFPS